MVMSMITSVHGQQSVELSGLYQGENLLVVNETNPDGVGFCCYEVRVNGQLTADEVNSHAFEVDLRSQGIVLGKGLSVRLMHRPGCAPRILNPEVVKPSPGFELIDFKVSSTGDVVWTSSEERGRMPYVLQQFKWGKWVDVVRVDGRGGPGERYYSAHIDPIFGENLLRLTHLAPDGSLEVKGEARFSAEVPQVDFEYNHKKQKIERLFFEGMAVKVSFAILHVASTSSTSAPGQRPSRSAERIRLRPNTYFQSIATCPRLQPPRPLKV